MIWTTWRQHRSEAVASLACLVAAAAFVLYASMHTDLTGWLEVVLVSLPGLLGVFIGAPLLARDIEQGTHRLVWTQGTTRSRWVGIKLVLAFAAVLASAVALGGLVTAVAHAQAPLVVRSGITTVRYGISAWQLFDQQAPASVAYAVFALALGVAVGAVVGRAYPAMALTLVLFVAVRVPVFALLRAHYLAPLRVPLETFGAIPATPAMQDPWFVGEAYLDTSGRALSTNDVVQIVSSHGGDPGLAANGLTGTAFFQPGDRFWTFQGIEAAIFLVLAALLVALAYYWATRRVT